jgi:hypothetical protein
VARWSSSSVRSDGIIGRDKPADAVNFSSTPASRWASCRSHNQRTRAARRVTNGARRDRIRKSCGCRAGPPNASGSHNSKNPAARILSTSGSGNRRSLSILPRDARISGARPRGANQGLSVRSGSRQPRRAAPSKTPTRHYVACCCCLGCHAVHGTAAAASRATRTIAAKTGCARSTVASAPRRPRHGEDRGR